MYKETGRININVTGIVSDINKDTDDAYMLVDGKKVYIKHSSKNITDNVEDGGYAKLACYLQDGKLFATSIG